VTVDFDASHESPYSDIICFAFELHPINLFQLVAGVGDAMLELAVGGEDYQTFTIPV